MRYAVLAALLGFLLLSQAGLAYDYFYDSFGTLGNWTANQGTWTQQWEAGAPLYQGFSDVTGWGLSALNKNYCNFAMTFRIKMKECAQTYGCWHGLALRAPDYYNGYYVYLNDKNGIIGMKVNNAPNSTWLGNHLTGVLAPDTWYWIKVIADGNKLSLYYSPDGVTYTTVVSAAQDSNYTCGNIVLANQENGTRTWYDDVKIAPIAPDGINNTFTEDFENFPVGSNASVPWTDVVAPSPTPPVTWSIEKEASGNKIFNFTSPPNWVQSYIPLEYTDAVYTARVRGGLPGAWRGYIVRGQTAGGWLGYHVTIEWNRLELKKNLNPYPQGVIAEYKNDTFKDRSIWIWLRTMVKGPHITVDYSLDGTNYVNAIDTLDSTYDKGNYFALETDTGGVVTSFDDVRIEPLLPTPPLGATLTTDNSTYRPGNVSHISLATTAPQKITDASLNVQKPDGTILPVVITQVNDTTWTADYTLPPQNGTYVLTSNFTDGLSTATVSRSLDVMAYRLTPTLNVTAVRPGGALLATLTATDIWKSGVEFTVRANLTDPAGATGQIATGKISGANSWSTAWSVPANAQTGQWQLIFSVNDSYGNTLALSKQFMVSAGMLYTIPDTWALTVSASGTNTRTFRLTNNATTSIHNITITPPSGINITPTNITELGVAVATDLTATWGATANVTGNIVISSVEVPTLLVPVTLRYTPGFTQPITYLQVAPDAVFLTSPVDKTVDITLTLTLDSASPAAATNIDWVLGNTALSGKVTPVNVPSSISPGESAQLVLRLSTAGLPEATHTSTITVDSSAGEAHSGLTLNVIADLSTAADKLESKLNALQQNITVLVNQGQGGTMQSDSDSIKGLLADVRSYWSTGEWADAKSKYDQASLAMDDLTDKVSSKMYVGPPPSSYGWRIWLIAAIIVIAIVAVFLLKHFGIIFKEQPAGAAAPEEYPEYQWPY